MSQSLTQCGGAYRYRECDVQKTRRPNISTFTVLYKKRGKKEKKNTSEARALLMASAFLLPPFLKCFLSLSCSLPLFLFRIRFIFRLQTTGSFRISLPKVEKTIPGLAKGGWEKRERELASTRRFSPCTTPVPLSNVLKA